MSFKRKHRIISIIVLSIWFYLPHLSAQLSDDLAVKIDSLIDVASKSTEKEKAVTYNKVIDNLLNVNETDSAFYYININVNIAKDNAVLGECFMYKSLALFKQENYPEALKSAFRALEKISLTSNTQDPKVISAKGEALDIIGTCYYHQGNMDSAFIGWNNAVSTYNEGIKYLSGKDSLDVKEKLPFLYNNLGVYFKNAGDYDKAIKQYKNSLKVSKELNLVDGQIKSLGNIGNIFFYSLGDYVKSLEHYQDAFDLLMDEKETNENMFMQSLLLHNMGLVYEKQGKFDKALNRFEKGLKFAKKSGTVYAQAISYASLGNLLLRLDYVSDTAVDFYNNKALELYTVMGSKPQIANFQSDLGHGKRRKGQIQEALQHFLEAEYLYQDLNMVKESMDLYDTLSVVYAELNQYSRAYDYLNMWVHLKDSLANNQSEELIREMSAKFDLDKKDLQIEQQEEKEKQRQVQLYIAIGVIVMVLVFTVALFKQFKDKKKANELLQEQHDEIKHQRDQIYKQKEEITDSIEYASKIQSALLPPDQNISHMLPQHMIFYKPRDIVSGDFYWFNQQGDKVYFCAADCTGHGVPGAFMSMLGVTLLNEIVTSNKDIDAAEILNQLRNQIVNSLHQTGKEGETQDGMDIAFCIIDKANMKLSFAGANNPVFIFRDGEIIEQKGDKMPIGVHIKQHVPFTAHEFDLKENDMIYTWSDGYVDQFGGPKEKKFLLKRFRQLLLDVHEKPMSAQYDALDDTLKDWMGSTSQIDDILVLGTKVKF